MVRVRGWVEGRGCCWAARQCGWYVWAVMLCLASQQQVSVWLLLCCAQALRRPRAHPHAYAQPCPLARCLLRSQTTARVWDALLHEGPKVLFRVALALLKLGEATLLQQVCLGGVKRLRRCQGELCGGGSGLGCCWVQPRLPW